MKMLGNADSKLIFLSDSEKIGFGSGNFDNLVRGKSKTLILIMSKKGFIFGAYIEDEWGQPGGWIVGSRNNFLFTFGSKENFRPIKLLSKENTLSIHITSCGAHFGESGGDLNAFCSHSCGTPSAYTIIAPGYPSVSIDSNLLAGESNYSPELIEVFQVV